ncbi:J domain-containing protein [Halopenitus persicus]|uniref:J domain-containing protein n=1 Tax=Halopenitus persicus TaxID=1048396 RepID=UPI000BBB544D|nr:J domain-containing protein [Halopenitus persicus]
MTDRPIVVGLAATFIGLTALLAVAGVVVHPILLFVAVPFGVAGYLLSLHARGRLDERIRARTVSRAAARGRERERRARERTRRNRAAAFGGGDRRRTGGGSGRAGGFGGGGGPNGPRDPGTRPTDRMGLETAYRTLGVEPDADEDTIKRAYRDRAKSLHPDAESGDEEAFKRLTRAYERLT